MGLVLATEGAAEVTAGLTPVRGSLSSPKIGAKAPQVLLPVASAQSKQGVKILPKFGAGAVAKALPLGGDLCGLRETPSPMLCPLPQLGVGGGDL